MSDFCECEALVGVHHRMEGCPERVVGTMPHTGARFEGPVLPADPLTGDPIRVTTAAISSYAKLLLERDEANAEVARLTAALAEVRARVLQPGEKIRLDVASFIDRALAGETTDTPRDSFEELIPLYESAVPAVPAYDPALSLRCQYGAHDDCDECGCPCHAFPAVPDKDA
jgi:hypothetical protein